MVEFLEDRMTKVERRHELREFGALLECRIVERGVVDHLRPDEDVLLEVVGPVEADAVVARRRAGFADRWCRSCIRCAARIESFGENW